MGDLIENEFDNIRFRRPSGSEFNSDDDNIEGIFHHRIRLHPASTKKRRKGKDGQISNDQAQRVRKVCSARGSALICLLCRDNIHEARCLSALCERILFKASGRGSWGSTVFTAFSVPSLIVCIPK